MKNKTLISLDEAIELINKYFDRHDENIYEKASLYNLIYKKQLKRYGPRHKVLLDKDEVIARFCA